jgi:hypothetical protein
MLQRRIVDFGADESFCRACEKMREHYGVEIAESSIRWIAEGHAENMKENERLQTDIADEDGVVCVIAELG